MDRTSGLASLHREYEEFVSLAESLTAEEWEKQSLCEDWLVRDVVAHVVTLDRATVTGAFFLEMLPGRGVESANDRLVAAWRERPSADLVAALKTWAHRQETMFGLLSRVIWSVRIPSPLGRLRGGSLIGARVYDLWVHNRDICVPLGRPEPDPARTAFPIQWMLDATGPMLGSHLHNHKGRTVGFDITGPVGGTYRWTIGKLDVDAVGDAYDADATIATDTRTFLLAGSGREKALDEKAAGHIKTSGNDDLADAFLGAWFIR